MKKGIVNTVLLLFIFIMGYSKQYPSDYPVPNALTIVVKGQIKEQGTGIPIPNHIVTVCVDSVNNFPYSKDIITNLSGKYADTISLPNGVTAGMVQVITIDCAPQLQSVRLHFNSSHTNLEHNFELQCANQWPSCYAEFAAYQDHDSILTIHFVDQSFYTIGSWHWDLGDGHTSDLQNPVHIYDSMGIYFVCLQIATPDGQCTKEFCDTVLVGTVGCRAEFGYFPVLGYDNTIHFENYSQNGPNPTFYWDFGDGKHSTEKDPVHSFDQMGWHHICLTLDDHLDGCSSKLSKYIMVWNGVSCVNYFTYTLNGYNATFEGHMVNGYPANYNWDFGDSQYGQGQSVQHHYTPGEYTIKLTTEDSTGCIYASTQMIEIGDTTKVNIYGQVFGGNFPVTSGIAMIFSIDTSGSYQPYIAVHPIDSLGIYYFTQVPHGAYYLYAIPLTPEGYIPTYFGDVLYWEHATIVHLGKPNNPYNIRLIRTDSLFPGNGSIHGLVQQGIKSDFLIDKIVMLLKNESGKVIGHYQLNQSGTFEFPSLAYGIYYLKAEIAEVTSDLVAVTLNAENPSATIHMTFAGNRILAIHEVKEIIKSVKIYPNPASTNITIDLTCSDNVIVHAELFNMIGQCVFTADKNLRKGLGQIRIDISSLPDGIYMVRLTAPDGIQTTRKILKSP